MEKQDYIKYWVTTSGEDLISMESVFNAGRYDWSLYIGHLALEKILKALWVKNNSNDNPPKTHNLKKIADEAKYPASEVEQFYFWRSMILILKHAIQIINSISIKNALKNLPKTILLR